MTDFQQLPVEATPGRVAIGQAGTRALEGLHRVGVGERSQGGALAEAAELAELLASSLADRVRQFALVIGEIQERFARGAFLAHEQQRNHRREQLQRYRQAQRLGFGEDAETLAEGAVADLVVVLQKQHEGVRRQVGTRFAARPAVAVGFALVDEAFGQAARQAAQRLGVVLVVAVVLAGEQDVQRMVAIVVPLCVVALAQQAGAVVVVLQDQVHMALGAGGAIGNRVHGIEAQAVDAIVEQPHQGVLIEELADFAATEIDGLAPGRLPVVAEERGGVLREVVAVRAEVVVDHVDEDHQAHAVSAVDQMLELLGRAVGRRRGERQHAVVAPVAATGKLAQWHQLHGGHAQFHQARKEVLDLGVGAEQADVQLVDHRFVPGPPAPLVDAPGVGAMVQHLAVSMHAVGLELRGRVRHPGATIDAVTVASRASGAQRPKQVRPLPWNWAPKRRRIAITGVPRAGPERYSSTGAGTGGCKAPPSRSRTSARPSPCSAWR